MRQRVGFVIFLLLVPFLNSGDLKEAMAAFLDKRKLNFTGL